jgi:hypothetical protein
VSEPRSLSQETRADVSGTTRASDHPPGYCGHIPREWAGNRGSEPRVDRSLQDTTVQFHVQKTGYTGYVPRGDMTAHTTGLNRTSTTYRDMCDELGYAQE